MTRKPAPARQRLGLRRPAARTGSRAMRGDDVVKSVGRVFRILELFDLQQREMSLTTIAERLRYPPSSASALLKSMTALGYLTFDQTRRTYMPTTRVGLLGNWAFGRLFGEARILQMMQYLHEQTDETILLGMQNDIFAQYIHVVQAKRHILYQVAPGSLRSLCRSAIGWVLLSAQSDAAIAKTVRRINAEVERRADRVDLGELMTKVSQVRAAGYVYSRNSVNDSVGAIAVLLPRPSGERPLAVGVAGLVKRLDASEAKIVKTISTAIARFVAAKT